MIMPINNDFEYIEPLWWGITIFDTISYHTPMFKYRYYYIIYYV